MISVGEFTISKVYDGAAGQQGEKGDSGISVVKVSTQYYLSSSPISLEDGDWEDTQPQVTTGKYLWQRTKTILSDNSVTYSDAVYAQTISGLVSDVDQVKGQITDKVWQSDITTSINTYDNSTVSTIRDRVSTTEQNLSGITTRVSDVESTTGDLGTRLTSAESSITQNADNIELKVSKDGVIASINESPESITISAEKVNIAGSASFTSLSNKVTAVENVADRNAELIRGTQTQGTYSWTGDSNAIAVLADGMEIRFWLPYSSDGTEVSDTITYFNGNTTSNKTNSGVGLRLTLKDGSSKTENIPVYYSGVTRLTTQYGYGNIIRMVYRENVKIHDSNITYYTVKKGFWCDANYDTNTSYVQYSSGMMVGANSVKPRSLVMRDTPTSIVSLSLSGGTDTNKSVYTGGLYYNKILYSIDNTTYATGETTGSIYDSYIIDLRYSTNCGSNLIASMPVYLVGTINNQDKMFYLDSTQWWTQTVPTSADGKTYIYLGEAYSTHNIYLAVENKAYQYYNGRFITLEEIKDLEAMTWINSTGQNAADIIANWATDATSATTTINGGLIQTHTIQASHLATNAIMSNNYQASQNAGSPYSVTGSFLDLDNGNFYTPNFGLDNVNGNAYFNGEITATSGQIGDDTSNHWQISTVVDFNGNQSAAIESNGTSYIQSGDWMISNNRIDTRHYDNQRKYTYLYEDGVYWDFGLHTPSLTSNNDYENNFIYIRNHESTIPTLEGAWNYVFRVDRNGMIYINGVSLDNKYASIDGVSGAYLPMTGGSLTGNLSVGGNLSVTGTITGLKNLSINGKTYNGSSAVTVGTIGAAYGGTGQTSLINSANALINALDTGSSTPVDNDYYISQYVNGGTTTKTYHRRPMSALWLYIKGKINADTNLYTDKFVPKTGGEFTGAVTVSDALIADEITSGNLIVNGVGRFTNGLYGDLTGNASTATVAAKVADSENGQATTFAYSKSSLSTTAYFAAWNGYELRAINPSNTLATIGAVNKTGDTMTGSLTVPTLKVNSIVNEGYVHRIDFGRPNVNQMDFYEYGGVFNFYRNTSPTSIENATLLGKITTNGWEGNVVGNVTGNASSASQLSTAGTIQTNLASTSAITYTSGGNITTGVTGTLPIANGGTGATTAQDALWNLARSADPSDLNTAKRLGIFKISNITTNIPVENRWGVALNITDDRAEGNTGTVGSTWQFVMDTSSTDVWLRRITNANAWTSWTKFYSTSNKPTKSDVGLGNVTNNAQVKGLSSGTTSGHLVTWGSDGYTVADSGIAKGSVTTKITLSGTDYSASSNTITITKANLQSAVQDTSLVLMTAAERSKLSSIQVSEGGTIDFSGVTASAPITATVNETTKAVNITHNTSGVAQGTYRSVTVNTYGHVTAGTNPTTLSGYGITDAKIASGVITLGSNTITPLTASSTLDATKLSGTASVNTTGNATTATKFSSNRSIALTGDVTGSASSNGENGWSIATTVGDDSHNHTLETIVPKMTKSYTGVIASANNDANCHMYYFKVVPDSYAGQWSIKYRVYATIDEVSTANGSGFEESVVYISGMRNTYSAYRTWNNISNASYRPYYYHTFYKAKEAGISYGHLLGVSLRYAYNPITTTNTRNVTFEILDYEGCTPTFFDSPIVYADASGTGSTNYEGLTTFDASTQGLTTSGDRNDVNYNNRENYGSRTTKNALYRYQICVTDSTGQIIPINSVNNSVATNKVLMTDSFDPFGEIFYWSSTSTYNAGANVGNSSWYRQYLADLRYSFNCGGYDTTPTLTARLPLYLVASPQTDGTAKLHSSPLSQTLPVSDDGLIYIYLGRVYEDTKPYRVVLSIHHPVYWYKDGAVRQYVQRAETANTANSATNATTATNATNLLAYASNEVTIGANSATSGSSTNNNVYINYRDVNGGSTSNNATAITDYYFYNRKGSMDGVNVRAGTFVGSLSGTATKATQDGSGNTITSYYVTLSTTQTISGAKTFSSAVTFANNTWNLMGDDAYIGDCNVSGKIGIKGKNAATGVRFVPYSGSTNNDITIDGTGNLTATGNLIQQGTVTVGSHAKLAYNESLECLEFSFV